MLVVCSRSSTKETRNTAVQEPNEAIDGAQQLLIMTLISNGDSVPVAFCATAAIRMVTVAIFHSYMAVKCTRRVQLKTKPGPGAPLLTTMTWISSGAIAEVMLLARCLNPTLPLHHVPLTATVSVLTGVLTTAVLKAQ